MAGGLSRRYGTDKAFARVGGIPLVRRAAAALRSVTGRVVLLGGDDDRYVAVGLETRPDVVPGVGALGGVQTAVAWARDEGLVGALVLACDMPFVPSGLLAELADGLHHGSVVVPASHGPRGFEPLCAAYGTGCMEAIDAAVGRGDRAVISFFSEVDVKVLAPAAVSRHGDPDTIFFNVNRPEDRALAESLLEELARDEEGEKP
jgi:molybdopterin-guanine dinucleotide biosynthesis protein A